MYYMIYSIIIKNQSLQSRKLKNKEDRWKKNTNNIIKSKKSIEISKDSNNSSNKNKR